MARTNFRQLEDDLKKHNNWIFSSSVFKYARYQDHTFLNAEGHLPKADMPSIIIHNGHLSDYLDYADSLSNDFLKDTLYCYLNKEDCNSLCLLAPTAATLKLGFVDDDLIGEIKLDLAKFGIIRFGLVAKSFSELITEVGSWRIVPTITPMIETIYDKYIEKVYPEEKEAFVTTATAAVLYLKQLYVSNDFDSEYIPRYDTSSPSLRNMT